MSDVDFNSILDMPVEEIKAKPPIPVGIYSFRIKSFENVISGKKKTNGVQFNCVPFEAKDDVDKELLAEAGGLADREFRHTFWITADAANMLKEFLTDTCGIEGSGKTLRQLIGEAEGACFNGSIVQNVSDNGRTYANIDKVFKYE